MYMGMLEGSEGGRELQLCSLECEGALWGGGG